MSEPLPTPRRQRMLVVLPTLVTLGNLASGFLAINYVGDYVADMTAAKGARTSGNQAQFAELLASGTLRLQLACWLIVAGMIFDALDGYVARLTRQQSDFGIELDSICDVVTFGIAPAFLAKSIINVELDVFAATGNPVVRDRFAWAIALVYAVCAACRLARFNVDTDEEDSHTEFVGLPSPAAAAVVVGVSIFYLSVFERGTGLWLVHVERFLVLLAGLLMVSRVRYVHAVNIYLTRRIRAKGGLALGAGLLLALLVFPEYVVPLAAIGYMLSGPIHTMRHRARDRRAALRSAAP